MRFFGDPQHERTCAPPQIYHYRAKNHGSCLLTGDGAAITDEDAVQVRGATASEVLLFDLA